MLAATFQVLIGDFEKKFLELNNEYDKLEKMKSNGLITPVDISQQRNLVKKLMQHTASKLGKAMYMAMFCFSFPIKTFMTFIYFSKTKSEYKLKTEDLFDAVITALVASWFYINVTYSRH